VALDAVEDLLRFIRRSAAALRERSVGDVLLAGIEGVAKASATYAARIRCM